MKIYIIAALVLLLLTIESSVFSETHGTLRCETKLPDGQRLYRQQEITSATADWVFTLQELKISVRAVSFPEKEHIQINATSGDGVLKTFIDAAEIDTSSGKLSLNCYYFD